eukprot:2345945-Rhodomonas_salina.1
MGLVTCAQPVALIEGLEEIAHVPRVVMYVPPGCSGWVENVALNRFAEPGDPHVPPNSQRVLGLERQDGASRKQ